MEGFPRADTAIDKPEVSKSPVTNLARSTAEVEPPNTQLHKCRRSVEREARECAKTSRDGGRRANSGKIRKEEDFAQGGTDPGWVSPAGEALSGGEMSEAGLGKGPSETGGRKLTAVTSAGSRGG